MTRFLLPLLALALLLGGTAFAQDVVEGRFTLRGWGGPALTVHYVEPPVIDPDMPVVFVMHGVKRNADEYAANWRDIVATHGVRVYAPEFSQRSFPGAAMYNLGGIGTNRPSAYTAIEPLFQAVKTRSDSAHGYVLFGHSAGAQFVHRALIFEHLDHLRFAISANAGWYTMPDEDAVWPYGLGGVEVEDGTLEAWLRSPLVVMLGDRDIDPQDPNLRHTPEADLQGPNRFIRGQTFFGAARQRADALGADFGWGLVTVPGVAHDNAGMASAAIPLIMMRDTAQQAD